MISKETKNQASIFLHQKSSDEFPYRDPSRSRFTLDSEVDPYVQRCYSYRNFLEYKYKGESLFRLWNSGNWYAEAY